MPKKILTLVDKLFDERELIYPAIRVKEAGYEVDFVGPKVGEFEGKEGVVQETSLEYKDVNVDDYAGVFVPGGYAPDKFRKSQDCLDIIKKFHEQGKPIGMICHAGWVGISAGILDGVKATSTPTIKDDMVNAGVNWVDEAPVVDGNIVTARNPQDLHVYVTAFLDLIK